MEEDVNRRLAAIVAADIANYSRLMGDDEEATLAALRSHRTELIDPKIAEYNGRIANTAGDSLLIEFPSVIAALRCSQAIQKEIMERNAGISEDRRIEYRIGINIGDVMELDGDLFGDGVNVAARIEALADVGGICLSRSARDQVRDRMDVTLEDLGEVEVKNIARPVRVFRVLREGDSPMGPLKQGKPRPVTFTVLAAAAALLIVAVAGALIWLEPWRAKTKTAATYHMAFPLPDKPSIAVLPFSNLSGDKSQEFLADGITDDIVTDLSKISGIFVIASHSMLTYKEKGATVRQISEELGVRYVLAGSVRRSDGKVRITAQLSDAIRSGTLWSERYDRQDNDIFAVQSEITRSVVKALEVTVKAREHDRVFQKYANNIEAYDFWRQARAIVEVPIPKNIAKGETLFQKVIALDPKFAGGYAGLSFNHSVKARFGYSKDRAAEVALAYKHAKKAIELDPDFAWSHIAYAGALVADNKFDAAVDAMSKALVIQPGDFETNLFAGFYLFRAGQPAAAIRHLKIADQLGRVPTYRLQAFLAISYFMNKDYAESEALWLQALDRFGAIRHNALYVVLAAAQIALNKPDAASETVARLKRINPNYRLSKSHTLKSYKSKDFIERLTKFAIKAGIPN